MAAKKTTKKVTSTGSPTLDAANAAKKFKAPKNYKPLTTAEKVAMAASVLPAGRAAKVIDKGVARLINSKTNKMMHFGGKTTKDAIKQRINANKIEKSYKSEARALKAANKPTNKIGSKADRKLRSETKSVQLSKEETKALYDINYGKGSGEGITQTNKQVTPKNEAQSVRQNPVNKAKGYKGNSTTPKKAVIKKKSK